MMQAEDNSRLDPKEEELEDKVERESRPEFRVYKRRWLVLALYLGYVVISAFQWIQYAIITDVIETYYDVPSIAVNWTSMIFMLAFVVTIFPATWFYNKVGLRVALLMAMGGTCVGTWIKVFSVRPDLFWVTMLGQTIVALCQMYVLSIPVPLAATWFGPNEVSTACSIGLLGPQIGGALGFFIPVALMPNDKEDIPGIERGLSYMFFGCSIFATVVFVLQLIFLQAAPPTPPSYAQASRNNERESLQHYVTSLWKLMKNVHFVLIFAAYSINLAVFSAITTFLNQMITPLYEEDAQDDAGYMGVLITLTGLVGSVLVGFILDRTRRYKEMNIIVYALSAAATIAFTFVLRAGNLPLLYVTTAVFGFTIVGYLPAAFEFAAELTYPEPEASSAGLMTFGCQILSVLFTLAYDWLFKPFGDLASNLFMSGSLLLGTLLTFFVKSDLRRQRAEHAHQ